jgi:hypothetical protein
VRGQGGGGDGGERYGAVEVVVVALGGGPVLRVAGVDERALAAVQRLAAPGGRDLHAVTCRLAPDAARHFQAAAAAAAAASAAAAPHASPLEPAAPSAAAGAQVGAAWGVSVRLRAVCAGTRDGAALRAYLAALPRPPPHGAGQGAAGAVAAPAFVVLCGGLAVAAALPADLPLDVALRPDGPAHRAAAHAAVARVAAALQGVTVGPGGGVDLAGLRGARGAWGVEAEVVAALWRVAGPRASVAGRPHIVPPLRPAPLPPPSLPAAHALSRPAGAGQGFVAGAGGQPAARPVMASAPLGAGPRPAGQAWGGMYGAGPPPQRPGHAATGPAAGPWPRLVAFAPQALSPLLPHAAAAGQGGAAWLAHPGGAPVVAWAPQARLPAGGAAGQAGTGPAAWQAQAGPATAVVWAAQTGAGWGSGPDGRTGPGEAR